MENDILEVIKFRKLLADRFYDYGYYNVYDSVFRKRVDKWLKNEKLKEDTRELGRHIQQTNATEVKTYIAFFKLVERDVMI